MAGGLNVYYAGREGAFVVCIAVETLSAVEALHVAGVECGEIALLQEGVEFGEALHDA